MGVSRSRCLVFNRFVFGGEELLAKVASGVGKVYIFRHRSIATKIRIPLTYVEQYLEKDG